MVVTGASAGVRRATAVEFARRGGRLTMTQLTAANTPPFQWVRGRLPHRAQPVRPTFALEVAARAFGGRSARSVPLEF